MRTFANEDKPQVVEACTHIIIIIVFIIVMIVIISIIKIIVMMMMMMARCALDSGTLTTDTEIIRMSHCGSFYFDDKYGTIINHHH